MPLVAIASFGAAIGLSIWQWGERKDLMEGALRLDELTLVLTMIFCVAGIAATLLAWRHIAPREAAHGEFYCLLLSATAGMFVLVAATNLVTLFLGLELLSIPLYVLAARPSGCAATRSRQGFKYLIVGAVGSATLLSRARASLRCDGRPRLQRHRSTRSRTRSESRRCCWLGGIALAMVGLAFKASAAPFHTWTPDVYQGAPDAGDGVHGGGDEGRRVRRDASCALRRRRSPAPDLAARRSRFLAVASIVVGNVGRAGADST